MNRFGSKDRSRAVAIWLFFCAALVFAMVVVGGVIPPADVQPLLDAGVAAVYPPGSVVAETAIDLIEKLNVRCGYAQKG